MKKALGATIFIFGLIIGGYGFSMDTTVNVSNEVLGDRKINNVGLLSDKQNIIYLGGVLLLAGVIIYATDTDDLKNELEKVKAILASRPDNK